MSGPNRFRRTTIAVTAVAALALAGCGDDSENATDNEEPAALDYSDPDAVVAAWGTAIAEGDCETAAELHITDSYGIDCADPDDHNLFAETKNQGLTFDGATPTDETQGSGEEAESYTLSFTTADGYLVTDHADLELRDGKYLVVNRGPELSDPETD